MMKTGPREIQLGLISPAEARNIRTVHEALPMNWPAKGGVEEGSYSLHNARRKHPRVQSAGIPSASSQIVKKR